MGTNETHERALAENEYYQDRHNQEEKKGDDEDIGTGIKRRQKMVDMKSKVFRNAFKKNSYSQVVKKFQKSFDDNMRELLQILTKEKRYETHIANLATRLDYNGYYSEIFSDIDVVIYPK